MWKTPSPQQTLERLRLGLGWNIKIIYLVSDLVQTTGLCWAFWKPEPGSSRGARGRGEARGETWGLERGEWAQQKGPSVGEKMDFLVSHLCCEMEWPRLVVRMVSSGLGAIRVTAEAVCAGWRAHSLEPGTLLCLVLTGPTGPFGRAFVGEETHRLLVSGTLTHGG